MYKLIQHNTKTVNLHIVCGVSKHDQYINSMATGTISSSGLLLDKCTVCRQSPPALHWPSAPTAGSPLLRPVATQWLHHLLQQTSL